MYLCIMFLKDALFLPTVTVVTLTWNTPVTDDSLSKTCAVFYRYW